MRVKETPEQRAAFEDGLGKWMGIEDSLIAKCDMVISSTDNVLVKGIADALKSDAQTHRELLGVIHDVLESTITLTPDELGTISKLLDDFVDMKKGSLEMAAHERTSGTHFVVRKLLDLILEDEKKYDRFREDFNEFKVKIYPYGVS